LFHIFFSQLCSFHISLTQTWQGVPEALAWQTQCNGAYVLGLPADQVTTILFVCLFVYFFFNSVLLLNVCLRFAVKQSRAATAQATTALFAT
jgi:hypothetical protein